MNLDEHTFILVDRRPVQHPQDDEWWNWFQNLDNRRVALTEIGDIIVSTGNCSDSTEGKTPL